MSEILKIGLLLTVLGVTMFFNVKYNQWFYTAKLLPIISEQDLINKDLNNKINKLQEIVDYLEFSLDVNNKMLEELMMEQIKRKGD